MRDELAREGARAMLATASQAEVLQLMSTRFGVNLTGPECTLVWPNSGPDLGVEKDSAHPYAFMEVAEAALDVLAVGTGRDLA